MASPAIVADPFSGLSLPKLGPEAPPVPETEPKRADPLPDAPPSPERTPTTPAPAPDPDKQPFFCPDPSECPTR